MNQSNNSILIWGSGKIGRGFVADLFAEADYQLNFIDANRELIEQLKRQRKYTILKMSAKGKVSRKVIKDYEAYHISEKDIIRQRLLSVPLIAVAVYPSVYAEITREIAGAIELRARENSGPLDIILCANILHPALEFRELLEGCLSDQAKDYFNKKVGLIESVVIRMAVEPSREMKEEDPLVVVTNGYPDMPVDKSGFKGNLPDIEGLVFSDNIEAEEIRKIYTYNMVHAIFGYLGNRKGYEYIMDCINDPDIYMIAEGALNEIGEALQEEYGFTKEEMDKWNRDLLDNMANPILKDKVSRVGADPVRKLKRGDRLTGPALLCRKHGILPYYIAKGIACAFLFEDPEDKEAQVIKEYIQEHDIKKAIEHFTGLKQEKELIQLIYEHYLKALDKVIKEDYKKVDLYKKAFKQGFKYEKTYKGCAQCAILGMFDVIDKKDNELFQSASGLSGGMGLYGDGSCGGYTGGVLLMGYIVGRRMDYLDVDGDKEDQYKSYGMAQRLHDKFIETYGSVKCSDIHEQIFGKAYCLKTKEVRDKFEEAGAHQDKCTSLIGTACQWVTEILIDEGYLKV